MERTELLGAIKRAQPAISAKGVVPSLASFFFDGEWVRAYDDEIAIETRCGLPVDGGINGKVLAGWLAA